MTQASAIIDGTAIAAGLRADITARVARHAAAGRVPGLAVVLVGDDAASAVYVRSKGRHATACGMNSFTHALPSATDQKTLLDLIATLNADQAVHGILVQLPLPAHIDERSVIEAIDPAKDVDGFHPINVGLLASGMPTLTPCTPRGSIMLLKSVRPDLSGLHAVVVGRSNIVGKPMAQLLLAENCTVTITHSRTADLPSVVRTGDIVVAAVGRPGFVRGEWLKAGAIVIDVGINRVADQDGKGRLIGDVAFDEARDVASAITPVPGGVGPMTIACLLENTLSALERSLN